MFEIAVGLNDQIWVNGPYYSTLKCHYECRKLKQGSTKDDCADPVAKSSTMTTSLIYSPPANNNEVVLDCGSKNHLTYSCLG